MNQLESHQTDLVGFPPDLTAPLRPAVPRRTQLPLDALDEATPAGLCAALSSPLSSPVGSPMIDVDDDLDELELDDVEDFDDADTDHDTVAPGVATLGDRARRLGARFAQKVLVPVTAIAILVIAMGGTWSTASATPTTLAATQPPAHAAAGDPAEHATHGGKAGHHELAGKLNLNTATEDQLMVLPSVGPAKAERIVTWRKKNGGFKRTADLRRVKGFGYKTFKKLEPYLDIKGDTTLAAK